MSKEASDLLASLGVPAARAREYSTRCLEQHGKSWSECLSQREQDRLDAIWHAAVHWIKFGIIVIVVAVRIFVACAHISTYIRTECMLLSIVHIFSLQPSNNGREVAETL